MKNPPSKFQHSFKYNFILRILFLLHYIIFSQYIYTHLEEAISRDQIFEAPQKSYTTNFERDSFDSTTIIGTNVITRVLRPFTSSPRSLWKSHPHEERKLAYTQENRRFNGSNSSAWILFTFHFPSQR